MHDPTPQAGSADRTPVDCARMALCVFAELTQLGGANAVADAEGVAAVSPELFTSLLLLLEADLIPVGSVLSAAFDAYASHCEQHGCGTPALIALLRYLCDVTTTMAEVDDAQCVEAIVGYFRERGWRGDESTKPAGA